MKPKFAAGDKVFAKVKGYVPWPARVEGLADERPNNIRYHVFFYGTDEIAIVKGENICPYVINKFSLGKPKKRKHFNKALLQIEAELSPDERQALFELEHSFNNNSSFNDTAGVKSRGRGRPKVKPKVEVNSDSGSEEDTKKKSFAVSVSDAGNSGNKIKLEQFADFEDEGGEEMSLVQQPSKPISKVSTVKKVSVSDADNSGNKIKLERFADFEDEGGEEMSLVQQPSKPISKVSTVKKVSVSDADNSGNKIKLERFADFEDEGGEEMSLVQQPSKPISKVSTVKKVSVSDADNSGNKIKLERFADFEDEGGEEMSLVQQPSKPISKVSTVKKVSVSDADNSGNKIKLERFADFEDEGGEEMSLVQQPSKPISEVSTVKKVEEDFLIAYGKNHKFKIPLGLNRPSFTSSKSLEEWKLKERNYANYLKARLEAGKTLPLSAEEYMFNWTKKHSQQHKKAKCIIPNAERGECLRTETALLECDVNIRNGLGIRFPDIKKSLAYLDQLGELKLTALMLKKHPEIVNTIKQVMKYSGSKRRVLTEEEEKAFQIDAEKIRLKAHHIYNKFQRLFFIPNDRSFWDVFQEENERFMEMTKYMSGEEIVGIYKDL